MTGSSAWNILRLGSWSRLDWCNAVDVHLLPDHRLEVEHGERVGTLPLLLACEVVDDQRNPATEDVHFIADERGAVQTSRQRRSSAGLRAAPRQRLDVKNPQVAQATSAHAAVDHQVVSADGLVVPGDRCVRFSRRRALAVCDWNLPTVLTVADVQYVQIVQIFGNVVLRIVGLVGEASKQKHFVADERKAVAETRTWRIAGERWL